ncbi:Arylsulfotransferase (ASST) [Dehalogenimonas alkenigignens]|uniref:Arylsulfotransferase (ASST) n=1 Tax=Dehalogenimonas alkenigignens TaxID=1217799 RepID=A0A0W0GL85_9CHLR|nr:aryl-sulfate sulfotransferase [Dehalogenimonas alkenigignens]KTB49299.1 Arylsulfotransferase (ASST) [Dehalogenimonas alkenigignens]
MSVTIYPTGTTIYAPEKAWNGFTILSTMDGNARLICMNGGEVKTWNGFGGFPNKVLPGGFLLGSTGVRNKKYGFQDQLDLVQVDWEGNVVWKFDRHEHIVDPGEEPRWMARQHHDYQREGNPVGYYVPGMEPKVDGGTTIILCHRNVNNPSISSKQLLDDVIIEVNWKGEKVWEWQCSDHFDELGFSKSAKRALAKHTNMLNIGEGFGDWMHLNSTSKLGPNRWYDAGDERFNPENLIWSSRQSNILAIIDKKTGNIAWKTGPDYNTKTHRKIGQIIGPHLAHMIPRGLPGEGNILVFDNGGWAGYGAPTPGSRSGVNNAIRDFSRVLEFDPVTLEIVWQYTAKEAGFRTPIYGSKFYSSIVSAAQRLPNGNTLITEGVEGRIFEVTNKHEIVWEYVNPHFGELSNLVYRAYRLPYEWVPQAGKPAETPINRLNVVDFKLTASTTTTHESREAPGKIKGTSDGQFCVLPAGED